MPVLLRIPYAAVGGRRVDSCDPYNNHADHQASESSRAGIRERKQVLGSQVGGITAPESPTEVLHADN